MVLDYLVSPANAKKDPSSLLIAAMVFVSFGVLVEIFIPSLRGSIIIFTMVPAIPLIWTLILEEEKDEEKAFEDAEKIWKYSLNESKLIPDSIQRIWNSHSHILRVIAFFFLGATIAYSLWFTALPLLEQSGYLPAGTGSRLFSDQLNELSNIRGTFSQVSGKLVFKEGQFYFLLAHNLQVLAVMFLFCLVYGIGSIYMLLWNASIIGVVVGGKISAGITSFGLPLSNGISNLPFSNMLPFETVKTVAAIISGVFAGVLGLVSLLPHGVFELGAYFVATLAGGIFSISVMRGLDKPEFKYILVDVLILTLISVVLIVIGAAVEASY